MCKAAAGGQRLIYARAYRTADLSAVAPRCFVNHSKALAATASKAPCSSKRWVAPGITVNSFGACSFS